MRARRIAIATGLGVAIALLPGPPSAVPARADAQSDASVAELMTRDLAGVPGKEVVVETVEYGPGGSSPAHRHDANVFVYVLSGEYTTQVAGSPPVTLHAGQVFYESPSDVHQRSENASKTAPVKFLVVMVKDKGRTQTRSAAPAQ
jgi:quercetin dioxygenase-like cupin family protein